jgi:hypothetical protein
MSSALAESVMRSEAINANVFLLMIDKCKIYGAKIRNFV